ncbi:MAG: acyl-ACP thioesterase domain-containing protein [Ilumatobacteraceae bacterium]
MSFGAASRAFEMVEPTGAGREFRSRRRVRLGDVTPKGRLRLDAVCRYLQDVANDDGRDAQWSDPHWWVVRRTVVHVHRFPVYLEEVDLTTWCGGSGSHWAERRTRISSIGGEPLVDAAALWVHVDRDTLQPSRVPADVAPVLAESSGGRRVGPRLILRHDAFDRATARTAGWPLRFSDYDTVGHMNNAAYWEVVEEHLAADVDVREGLRAVMEHVHQVEPGEVLERAWNTDDGVSMVLSCGGATRAAAWVGAVS